MHPAQTQSLIVACEVVLQGRSMLGDGLSLSQFFRSRNLNPAEIDVARNVLEKGSLFMPCMATLPNRLSLTHPVFVLQGDVTVLPPTGRGARTETAGASSENQRLKAPVLIVASPDYPVCIRVDAVASAGSKGASAPRIIVLPSHTVIANAVEVSAAAARAS